MRGGEHEIGLGAVRDDIHGDDIHGFDVTRENCSVVLANMGSLNIHDPCNLCTLQYGCARRSGLIVTSSSLH